MKHKKKLRVLVGIAALTTAIAFIVKLILRK